MASATTLLVVLVAAIMALHYTGNELLLTRTISRIIHGKPGCFPVKTIEHVKLHYFSGRGRGESMRLLAHEWNISLSETKYTREAWPKAKKLGMDSGLLLFGQVPAIETSDGKKLVQSHVILRYLGRSVGIGCECDELDYCDIIALGIDDMSKQLGKILYDTSFTVEKRDNYLKSMLPIWLKHFEKLLPEVPSSDNIAYIINNHLTWVDYLLCATLDFMVEFGKFSLPGDPLDRNQYDALKDFPKLTAYYKGMMNRPGIVRYLQSDQRAAFTIPYVPKVAAKN